MWLLASMGCALAQTMSEPEALARAEKFTDQVVRVIPQRTDGMADQAVAGFGLIVGERTGRAFIATPYHVAFGNERPSSLNATPGIIFRGEQYTTIQARRLPVASPTDDLAVIEVALPRGITLPQAPRVEAAQLPRGTWVWNIGIGQGWDTPPRAGGLDRDEPISRWRRVGGLRTPSGASGGAAVTAGGVIGMVLQDAGDYSLLLPVERIVQLFIAWNLPVNLLTVPNQAVPSPQATLAPSLPPPTPRGVYNLLSTFGHVFERVRADYVDRPDDKKLLMAAIDGMQAAFPTAPSTLLAGTPVQQISNAANVYAMLAVVGDTFERIRGDLSTYDDDVRLTVAAINGMLSVLDPHSAYLLDPRSSYLDAKYFDETLAQYRGEFGVLGLDVSLEGGLIKVVTLLDDSPAAKAGIMPNDIITHIDTAPVQGLTLNQAVEKMRGQLNTRARLTIVREGLNRPVEVSFTRETIRERAVRFRLEGGDVAYIRISEFSDQATQGTRAAISTLNNQAGDKLKGFIIDLRNNPGGLLDQAISISDAFLQRGAIVMIRGRDAEETQHFNARPDDLSNNKPIIVLINGGTVGGAEIVAGALQDNKRATILGTRSFGMGTVQKVIQIDPTTGLGALRLTTARSFRPSGRFIQAKGIAPDIEVIQDIPAALTGAILRSESFLPGHLKGDGQEATGSQSYIPPDAKNDKALNTALDLIRGIQKNSAYPPNPRLGVPN